MNATWAVVKFKPEKHSDLNRNRTAMPVQCSTNWGMKALWVRIIPVDDGELSCVHNCDDQSCLCVFLRSSNIWSFVYSLAILSQFTQIFGLFFFFQQLKLFQYNREGFKAIKSCARHSNPFPSKCPLKGTRGGSGNQSDASFKVSISPNFCIFCHP